MSTPFDLEAVDFLDPLMSSFKVASADITNYPLLEKIASKDKPMLLST
jgi:N-acetylneuraminate synthase